YCQPTLNMIFGHKTRIRSVDNVIEELKFLTKKYKINSFIFTDDTPTFFKKWIVEFSNRLIDAKLDFLWGCNTRVGLLDKDTIEIMYRAGFRRLMVGIESANQRIISNIYKKGINVNEVERFCRMVKNVGVKVFGYFMLGAPTETIQEVKNTINFAFKLPIDEVTFSLTTPLPGTELERMVRENGIQLSRDYSEYNYYSARPYKSEINFFVLRNMQRIAFIKFYLHPNRLKYLLNSFTSASALRKTCLKLKRLI
ncbi:MAG: B12-binding domain-containing radical SAM protein, partial [Promethearchaeota archaeon]